MKPIIVLEFTRIEPKGGMIKKYGRVSITVQLKSQSIPRKAKVKMEWSLYSHISHTFWSSNIERKVKN